MKCPFVHTYEHSPTHTSKHTLTNSLTHSLSSTHTLTTHIRCAAQQKWPTSENVDRLLCCPSVNKFVVCAAPLPLSPPFCTSSLPLSLCTSISFIRLALSALLEIPVKSKVAGPAEIKGHMSPPGKMLRF